MSTQTDTVRYELMVIVAPDLGETAIKKRLESIKKSITDFGGEVFFEDVWGLRNLAYDIRKHGQGFYAVMDLNLNPENVKELERILRLEVEVLRHLLIKLPSVYQPKTLAEMDAENAVEEEKINAAKEEKKPKGGMMRPSPAPRAAAPVEAPKMEKAPEKAPAKPAPKAAKKEEAAEEPKKTGKKKESIQDIDAKLDSILSNPDINF